MSLCLYVQGGAGEAGRQNERTEGIGLSPSGAKSSFGTCLALGYRAYIIYVGVHSVKDRCIVGIHKHPSAAGWITARGLVVLLGAKARVRVTKSLSLTTTTF